MGAGRLLLPLLYSALTTAGLVAVVSVAVGAWFELSPRFVRRNRTAATTPGASEDDVPGNGDAADDGSLDGLLIPPVLTLLAYPRMAEQGRAGAGALAAVASVPALARAGWLG